jgi:hypothetical protein
LMSCLALGEVQAETDDYFPLHPGDLWIYAATWGRSGVRPVASGGIWHMGILARLIGSVMVLVSCSGDGPVAPCGSLPFFPDQAAKLDGDWVIIAVDSSRAGITDTLFINISSLRAKSLCVDSGWLFVHGVLGGGFPDSTEAFLAENPQGYHGTGFFIERGHIKISMERVDEPIEALSYTGELIMESETKWSGEYTHQRVDISSLNREFSSGSWIARKRV